MEIPFETSDPDAKQEAHMLLGFGSTGVPHKQHRTLTMVPCEMATDSILRMELPVMGEL